MVVMTMMYDGEVLTVVFMVKLMMVMRIMVTMMMMMMMVMIMVISFWGRLIRQIGG